ncbi:hypothetical protein [Nigerium massiliense]|uniref:hypothetical protein n=1 Tax=Nigerium massiliense TaxID=1522317 RepID=UPI001588272B|nr:hypothetical protein [Nigerium massiliense]
MTHDPVPAASAPVGQAPGGRATRSRYQHLDPYAVKATVDRLTGRIEARFPGRNLPKVCRSIGEAVDDLLIQPQPRSFRTSRYGSRILIVALLSVVVVGLGALLVQSANARQPETWWEWAPLIESMVNDLVFAGIAVYFLWQLPHRAQREHDLAALYRLRSLAHVIDMHQLTKDPERFRPASAPPAPPWTSAWTPATSPPTSTTARRCCRSSAKPLPCSPSTAPIKPCFRPSRASRS